MTAIIKTSVLFYITFVINLSEEKCRDESTCIQQKIHGLRSADCYNRNFKKFPRCLRSDVEVISICLIRQTEKF